jgi:hypothetical protein
MCSRYPDWMTLEHSVRTVVIYHPLECIAMFDSIVGYCLAKDLVLKVSSKLKEQVS